VFKKIVPAVAVFCVVRRAVSLRGAALREGELAMHAKRPYCFLIICLLALAPVTRTALAAEQTTSARLMALEAVPTTNTDAGQRILKGAPEGGPVFKTFADFLGAVAERKILPIEISPKVPASVSAKLNVVFQKGDNYELKLNFFAPKKSDKPLPLVVMVHGGCWIDGGRVDYN
jgi:acetyl esterase/lipase